MWVVVVDSPDPDTAMMDRSVCGRRGGTPVGRMSSRAWQLAGPTSWSDGWEGGGLLGTQGRAP